MLCVLSSQVALANRIFEREFLLPEDIQEAAQSHTGDLSRLRVALTKLINGVPLSKFIPSAMRIHNTSCAMCFRLTNQPL
jgi:hypothetical protein